MASHLFFSSSLSRVLALAALAALVLCAAKKHVISLSARNFEQEIKKHSFVVVEFYAPWCQHCQKLEPEYEKAAKKLAKSGSGIVLAKVNTDESANKKLSEKYAPQLPTIKIFRDGNIQNPESYDLSGPIEGNGMAEFLKMLAKPASVELTSAEEVQEVLQKEKVAVVGVFPEGGFEAEREVFLEVGQALRAHFNFMHTPDASLLPQEHPQPQSLPAVRVLTTLREEEYADTGDFNTSALKEFVLLHSLPPVMDYFLSEDDIPVLTRAFSLNSKKCWMLMDVNSSQVEEYREALGTVAEASTAQGLILMIGEDKANEDLLQNFQLNSSACPCLVIVDPDDNGRYFKTQVEPSEVPQFITSYLAGEEENRIKSQPIPEESRGAVKEVVAKNFKEIVLNSGKDVLIKFYAPWCSYCQDLAPVFEEIALDLQEYPGFLAVKMDLTENDIPSNKFEAKGYPTLYLYTKAGEAIKFDGERRKEEITSFVLNHMTIGEEEEENWEEDTTPESSQQSQNDEL